MTMGKNFIESLTDLSRRLEPGSNEALEHVLNSVSQVNGPWRSLNVPEYIEAVFVAPALAQLVSNYFAQNRPVDVEKIKRIIRDIQQRNNIGDAITDEYIALLEGTFDSKTALRNEALVLQHASHVKFDQWVVRLFAICGFGFLALMFSWTAQMSESGFERDIDWLVESFSGSQVDTLRILLRDLSAQHIGAGLLVCGILSFLLLMGLTLFRRLLVSRRTLEPNNATIVQTCLTLSELGLHGGYIIKTSKSGEYFTISRILGRPIVAVPEGKLSQFYVAHEAYHVIARDYRSPTRLPHWLLWGSIVIFIIVSLPIGLATEWKVFQITVIPIWPLLFCFIWFDRLCELRADLFASMHFHLPARAVNAPRRSTVHRLVNSLQELRYPGDEKRKKYLTDPGAVEFGFVTMLAIACLSFSLYYLFGELAGLANSSLTGLVVFSVFNYGFATLWLVFVIRQSRIIPLTINRAIVALAYYFVLSALLPLVLIAISDELRAIIAMAPSDLVVELVRNQLIAALSFLLITAIIFIPLFGAPYLARRG